MKKRRLSQAEFDTIHPLIRMSPERVESARLVLVDGLTYEAAGRKRPGPKPYTRQAVGDAVGIVWRMYETYRETQEVRERVGIVMPPGWEAATLVGPADVIAEFRERIAGIDLPAPARRTKPVATKTRAE